MSAHTRRVRRLLGVTMLAAVACLATACDVITSVGPKSCDRDEEANPPITYSAGSSEDGTYMSSPWDGELLYFPGGIQYRLEHKLGSVPRSWQVYLSFDERGTGEATVAPAAGNQVEILDVDDTAITLRNGTCADYWLLVVASTSDDAT